nr:immunoglobulin light chain junction region [Macaca mulatta]MOV96022.1 immunoglobulin light chain junction region [Macaca mulatta]MOV96594.1 immunoglobulin light chain junction region [Macaca mulatta]MOV98545.1 immunoglobulin light chain junction region [Macaca mulatta]MOW00828.1 immunoglobulin light chain junction region [Macaca mulatta]
DYYCYSGNDKDGFF